MLRVTGKTPPICDVPYVWCSDTRYFTSVRMTTKRKDSHKKYLPNSVYHVRIDEKSFLIVLLDVHQSRLCSLDFVNKSLQKKRYSIVFRIKTNEIDRIRNTFIYTVPFLTQQRFFYLFEAHTVFYLQ